MMQAAQDRPRHDPATDEAVAAKRTLQAEAAVRPVAIVVIGELGQYRAQVTLVDHDHDNRAPKEEPRSRVCVRHFATSNRKWVAPGVSIELVLLNSIPSGSRSSKSRMPCRGVWG